MKRIAKFICGIITALFVIEILLQFLGYLYVSTHFAKPKSLQQNTDKAVKILFIGDSWTQGADASFGEGYPDLLTNMLKREFPDIDIQEFNFGHGSFNSAEASIKFLQIYKKINPHILVSLIGINNIWNTHDIELAKKYFLREIHEFDSEDITPLDILASKMKKLKTLKILTLIWYNTTIKQEGFKGPHPMNDYIGPYFELHGQGRVEEARKYLVKTCNGPSQYDDLYQIMLYSFSFDKNAVETYLKENDFWHPEWIKYTFDAKKRLSYLDQKDRLLERHLTSLSNICKRDNIIFIVQTYPFFQEGYAFLNTTIRKVAYKHNIYLVDHASLFQEELGSNYKMHQTFSHVNTQGHLRIAKNLFNFFLKQEIIKTVSQPNPEWRSSRRVSSGCRRASSMKRFIRHRKTAQNPVREVFLPALSH